MAEPKIADLLASGQNVLVQAYKRGVKDGIAWAREKLLSSLADPDEGEAIEGAGTVSMESPSVAKAPADVLPRGTVRPIVRQVLTEHPGSTIADAQRFVSRIDSRISPLSVGNELRRNKDKLYRKRARRWYLIKEAENETAGNALRAAPAASPNLNQGDFYEAVPLAASPSG